MQRVAGVLAIALLGTALELTNPVHPAREAVTFVFTGVEDASPVVKSIQDAVTLATVAADIPLERQSNNEAVFTLDGALAIPGLYKLLVQDGKASKVFHATLTTSVSLSSAVVQGINLPFGSTLSSVVNLTPRDTFSVEVELQDASTLTPVVPHHAVLRFAHESSVDATIVLEPYQATAMRAVVSVASRGLLSGLHTVSLVVGDIHFHNALAWELGQINVELPPAPPASPTPLYTTPLLHTSDTTLQALPEITHIMRPPPTTPPPAISIVFTALVGVPLVAFVGGSLRASSLPKLPSSVAGIVWSVAFLVSLLSVLALFGLYWLQLDMFTALGYLGVLGPVIVVTGQYALAHVAARTTSPRPKTD
ncbi:hypothetical protein, variant [Aphanomyces astaci]|uniref:Ribophorin II n=1 Tax=Aphanomyces astaci TaxID=112090 RepID=W4H2A9_APHAT|nr:hypothetical protein H257_02320 [Aphanomyces astaci]XP_009824194.1 hypothetical protein, variant [Aphanomyces astaci]ETV85721.1 hypothetical protein H257_02320 [Aphanomyces astaci]ETV85722.1 hypothetical protein, variant [Aphanomyces astaci]RQM10660.1 hypothetical protein B5M09_007067 [Aphanomyces astaci]|eukprot:XP_009824193.1 hypothetical protein H257_02320 [Aphanomyces astaci]